MPLSTESTKHDDKDEKAAQAREATAATHAAGKPVAKPANLSDALNEAGILEEEKREEDRRRTAASQKFQEKYNRLPLTEEEYGEFLTKK